ncbi:uncharacterized protein KY384_001880 [Bacidia gigantensis]|uniref:uncharacterized protein n=1 Tax=Bacidia gigantensis TaxID=2732470 RepID=UPI001D049B3D|nr:uncharacterized protein KY384_001880 [Bacidia gigantensis]KAG8533097.1 hypothetical protein KY384_001880 [Bacidia gigantensis]
MMRNHIIAFSICLISVATAASSWGFDDATVSVHQKGAGAVEQKEKFTAGKPLKNAIQLEAQDTMKLILTTKEGNKAKRAHQTFLLLEDPTSGLETSFPFQVKESGKGKLDLVRILNSL